MIQLEDSHFLEAPASPPPGLDWTREGFADFHALRHTFISRLIRSGANPKTVQTLARHHDAALTLNRYTHIQSIDQREAQEALPSLEVKPVAATAEATGTDAEKCRHYVDTYVDTQAAQPAISSHSLSSKVKEIRGGNPLQTKTLGNDCHSLSPNVNNVKYLEAAGVEPASQCNVKPINSTSKANHQNPVSAPTSALSAKKQPTLDSELQFIVENWENIPKAIREGISIMVKTAIGGDSKKGNNND